MTQNLNIRQLNIELDLKFYKPSLNKYIIHKLCNAEILVHLEERAYNFPKVCLERDPQLNVWLHELPSLGIPTDELGAARAEVYVCVP